MKSYLLKRLLVAIPSLVIASVIVFTLPRLLPGDAVQLMVEEKAYGKDLDDLRAKLGLDRPIYVQYFSWLGNIARGNLGESLWTKRAVSEELARRLPVTLSLGLMSICFAILMAIPIGVLAAVRADTLRDYAARSVAILGLSVPGFWMATLVIILPAMWWGWTPILSFTEFSQDPLKYGLQFLLPAAILGIASAAAIMRLTRAMLLEVLRQDYVRTAWAKGLNGRRVVIVHALRNAMLPVLTVLGIQAGTLVGGTVVIEQVFAIPGMGRLAVSSVFSQDIPVLQGIVLLAAIAVLITNLLTDVAYSVLDPRIRYG
jgi:peptide/nickel transport system permease protein